MNRLKMLLGCVLTCGVAAAAPDAWECSTLMENGMKVADWMLAHPPRGNHKDWTYGAFYAGLTAFGLSCPSSRYLDVVREEGRRYGWKLEGRPYHADSHCIGQAWLELARTDDSLAAATPVIKALDFVLDYRSRTPVAQNTPKGLKMNFDRWCWCDALFMAPPVWAKLAAYTGEAKYRDFMISEYRATHAKLYDKEEHLFYRDSRYVGKTTKNGRKVFWSRGCGWVFGGLPLVIRELPPGLKSRPFFETLFKEMAAALKACQRPDGAWSPSLLDAEDPDMQEMSGTSFFCYGMMWGVNNGLLPADEYLPCVKKAWAAMCRNVDENGKFGWVQQIGDRPVQDFGPDSTEVYAVGAYLLAATEIRKHVVSRAHLDAKTVDVAAVRRFRVDTVEVPWKDLGLADKDLVVFDMRNAAVLPHQLFDEDGDGAPDKLLFPSAFASDVPGTFKVFNDASLALRDQEHVCFGRHAPDRLDDYLWENDKTAWRIYGPGVAQPPPKGEGLVSSGVDVWSKKVGYPVIDKWLKLKHYHTDSGEGMDNYKVGTARGTGGFAIWREGRAFAAGNWATQRCICTGPVRTAFEVAYAPVACGGGVTVRERRVVTLDRGQRFTKHVATLEVSGASEIAGGPGVNISRAKQHAGILTARPDLGWVANFEAEQKGKGSILTSIFTPAPADLQMTDQGDLLLVRAIRNGQPVTWYAGSAWTGRGEVMTPCEWNEAVLRAHAAALQPLAVRVR